MKHKFIIKCQDAVTRVIKLILLIWKNQIITVEKYQHSIIIMVKIQHTYFLLAIVSLSILKLPEL
jgi:hypothetical protein